MELTKLKSKVVASSNRKAKMEISDEDRAKLEKLFQPVGSGSERPWETIGRIIAEYKVEGVEEREVPQKVWDRLSNKERFVLLAGHLSSAVHYGSKTTFAGMKIPANGITIPTIVHLYEALDGLAARKPSDNEWGMTGGWTDAKSVNTLIRFIPPVPKPTTIKAK